MLRIRCCTIWMVLMIVLFGNALWSQEPHKSPLARVAPLNNSEIGIAKKGETIFTDSKRRFDKLPALLDGLAFIRGSVKDSFAVMPITTGRIFVVTTPEQARSDFQETETPTALFSDPQRSLKLYSKQINYQNFRLPPLSFNAGEIVFFSPDSMAARQIPAKLAIFPPPVFDKTKRLWQGCPSIEKTGNRLWAAWFSGGAREPDAGNYGIISYSDDNGVNWYDPAITISHSDTGVRVMDPQLWKDPAGKLWIFWVQNQGASGFDGLWSTWAVQLQNPESKVLTWTKPKRLCNGLLRNKPIVLKNGSWLLPSYNWVPDFRSAVYVSTDKGNTWHLQGGPVNDRSQNFYEHMIIELKDKRLWLLQRNIQESYSSDGGKNWTKLSPVNGLTSANSRLYLGRLRSGNLLLVYNDDPERKIRQNLTAFLSKDDGKTWPYKLLIDKRTNVSYPDVTQDVSGRIYLCYDRGRTTDKEILLSEFTEDDILKGKLPQGYSVKIISKIQSDSFQAGSKKWPLEQRTPKGTPIVSMWKIPLAKDSSAYPAVRAEHQLVWSPANVQEGGYNHYACLIRYKNKLFAMWSNHPFGEDAPGQRVLYSVSDQWGSWSKPRELFAAPGPVKDRHVKGIHLKADRWAIVDDSLYAIVYVHGAGIYPIARRLGINGEVGGSFLLDTLAPGAALPAYMSDSTPAAVGRKLKDWYRLNDKVSWWASKNQGVDRKAVDSASLIETFMYRAKDSTLVMMFRNWGTKSNPVHNNRVYVSFSKDYYNWSPPYPSDIPDAPTRGNALRLQDGTILLIGTHYVPYLDSALYLDRDPLTVSVSKDGYRFTKAYSIRTGAPKTWHIPNVSGRNPGFAYSSSIIDDGFLYTLYSIGKEDIAISRVPLNEMLK